MLRVLMPFTGKETHVTFSAEAFGRLKTGLRPRFPLLRPAARRRPESGAPEDLRSQSAYAGRAISALAVDTGGQHTKVA
jgi:hypothetical protein